MDKKFVYSAVVFLVFSALPIGGFMLSVAMYPDAEFTAYMVNNFAYLLASLVGITVALMAVVFYVYSD